MPLTRRQFAIASTSLVALTVLGCDNTPAQPKSKPKPPTEPFAVGDPADYRSPGLYDKYNVDKRVWLVSDGKTLVAFVDQCTHTGCALDKASSRSLSCPCHGSVFDLEGTPTANSRARSLERFAIGVVQTPEGPRVRVDPTKRFLKEKGQWSDPLASLTLPA